MKVEDRTMLEKMKKGKRIYKVNTVTRGRGEIILRCRTKEFNSQEIHTWEVCRRYDGRLVARNNEKGIYIEHPDGLKGLYKVLDSKCRYAKWGGLILDDEFDYIYDEDDIFDNDLEDIITMLMA